MDYSITIRTASIELRFSSMSEPSRTLNSGEGGSLSILSAIWTVDVPPIESKATT